MTSFSGRLPQLRTNAFPIISMPTSCRLAVCKIGGTKEVREAIQASHSNLVGARIERGVILFGGDSEIRRTFESHNLERLDAHTLHSRGLGSSSSEVGLLYDALTKAIGSAIPVNVYRGRESALLALKSEANGDPRFASLKAATRGLVGTANGLMWSEALRIQLDFRLDRAWLLAEPTIWMERTEDEQLRHTKAAWINARLRGRYNTPSYNILKGWAAAIFDGKTEVRLRTIGCNDGLDAEFVLSSNTGVSGKSG